MSGFESEVRQAPIAPQKAAPSIVSIVGGEWNEWNLKTLAGTRDLLSRYLMKHRGRKKPPPLNCERAFLPTKGLIESQTLILTPD
jgi:hypothetical protein